MKTAFAGPEFWQANQQGIARRPHSGLCPNCRGQCRRRRQCRKVPARSKGLLGPAGIRVPEYWLNKLGTDEDESTAQLVVVW